MDELHILAQQSLGNSCASDGCDHVAWKVEFFFPFFYVLIFVCFFSDALLEFSLGFLAAFQSVLCQCEDLNEISKLLDSLMASYLPTPGNVERMQSCIGQLDRRDLLTLRHRVFERAESRLREYSTASTFFFLSLCF